MKIIVPIRRVPDPERPLHVVNDIVEPGRWIVNPEDEAAVETAVRLREAGAAVEIVAVAIGRGCEELSISALARGADRAYVADLPEGDCRATVDLLAYFFHREQVDLVLIGDCPLDSGETGPRLAGLLDAPQATEVERMEIATQSVRVERRLSLCRETLELSLPAVVTLARSPEPASIVSLYAIVEARGKEVERLAAEPAVSSVTVVGASAAGAKRANRMVESVDELVAALREEARVI